MKIVVCIKQIRHIYARTGLDPATHFIAEDDVVHIVNPLDELAVEEALRLKEAHGGEVILLTVGKLVAEEALRHCLAMGADRMIRISDPCPDTADAWSTGVMLSEAVRRLEPDLVLCGRQALDDRAGQVGVIVAELTGNPCVCGIVRLECNPEEKKAIVHKALERGDREVVECPLPALFTVDKGINEPRYPRTADLLKAEAETIERWDAAGLIPDPDRVKPLTRVAKVTPPKPRTRKVRAPSSSMAAQDRIRMLMGGGTAQQKKKESSGPVELPPEKTAEKILAFLQENKIL